ncbi:LysR family transcriptional regulator, partial [Hypericibacter sp.]|uniref:LysR family transcriptional regulator n=1 Tax=Hypericibacter sp. TaxID=2705401 RepID=UPI003D6CCDAC
MLRILVALDEQRSLTAAAQSLGLTQSALSHQLREAERRFGVGFAERVGNRLRLTALGQQLLSTGRSVLDQVDRAESDLLRFQTGRQAAVRIGFHAHNAHHWLAGFLAEARKQPETPPIELVADAMALPFSALQTAKVDIALSCSASIPRSLRSLTLYEDELVAVLPVTHALRSKAALGARDFANQTYVCSSIVIEEGMEYSTFFRPAGVRLDRSVSVGSVDAVLSGIEAGLGVSILPRSCVTPRWSADNVLL